MSFIPFIRDYVELINNIFDATIKETNFIDLYKFFQETFIYSIQTFQFIIIYIVTFQWFRDLMYLPVIVPEISSAILKERFFLEVPLENFFTILEIPSYNNNKFLIGFFNSFFLTLPFSCAQLIYLRRLLIQGNIAGISSGLGNILGQLFFIASILFGFRTLIVSWFSFEPLNYFLGFILILSIVYDMIHERVIKIINWNNKEAILKIFFLNFLLMWTEQSSIFSYLGNMTIEADSSYVNSYISENSFQNFTIHGSYLIGLFFGSLFFNFLFIYFVKSFNELLQTQFSILKSTWIIRLNYFLLTVIIAFTFTSIPFYGLEYLITQPLGFISQDKAFKNTLFSPNEVTDPFFILSNRGIPVSLATDITSFDRGFYLTSQLPQSFEELNYSGEYATEVRQGKVLLEQYGDKAKKFREFIGQKGTSKKSNETLDEDIILSKNPLNNVQNEEFPTYYSIDKIIPSGIQKRNNLYIKPSNEVFKNFLENTFSPEFLESNSLTPNVDKMIKQKFYSNPVYKFLLNSDIDQFLKRQPSSFILSPREETELYRKRLVLSRYNDSLRFYNNLPYTEEFQYLFNGSKTFANRVYNQQFKGTLHVVRRLFNISLNSFDDIETSDFNSDFSTDEVLLKYDQPLFKKNLEPQTYNSELTKNPFKHEELGQKSKANLQNPKKRLISESEGFIELISQNPLYLGWDENLRKIIITNRILPKTKSNYSQIFKNTDSSLEEKTGTNNIAFTTWPSTINQLDDSNVFVNSRLLFQTKNTLEKSNLKKSNLITYLNLFKYKEKQDEPPYYESLPSNIIKILPAMVDVIPPNRGGFIWPGTSSLKLSIKDLLKK